MRVMQIRPGQPIECGDLSLLERLNSDTAGWFWLDLQSPDHAEEQRLLSQRFGIHRLALQDAQNERHPPKVEVFGDTMFLLMKGLTADTSDIRYRTLQIAAFVQPRILITRRDQESVSIDGIWRQIAESGMSPEGGPAHVLYRISRRLTDRYTKIVLALEMRLEELEDEMFEHPGDSVLEELTEYSSRLKKLRRVMTYQHAAMQQLARLSAPPSFATSQHEFHDVYENTERLASLCALYQELASDLIQTYISLSSHRLNQIIKVLTIVTVIFLPLGLIAGLYGMNFAELPGGEIHGGFFLTLMGMLGIASALLIAFRKLKWI